MLNLHMMLFFLLIEIEHALKQYWHSALVFRLVNTCLQLCQISRAWIQNISVLHMCSTGTCMLLHAISLESNSHAM